MGIEQQVLARIALAADVGCGGVGVVPERQAKALGGHPHQGGEQPARHPGQGGEAHRHGEVADQLAQDLDQEVGAVLQVARPGRRHADVVQLLAARLIEVIVAEQLMHAHQPGDGQGHRRAADELGPEHGGEGAHQGQQHFRADQAAGLLGQLGLELGRAHRPVKHLGHAVERGHDGGIVVAPPVGALGVAAAAVRIEPQERRPVGSRMVVLEVVADGHLAARRLQEDVDVFLLGLARDGVQKLAAAELPVGAPGDPQALGEVHRDGDLGLAPVRLAEVDLAGRDVAPLAVEDEQRALIEPEIRKTDHAARPAARRPRS